MLYGICTDGRRESRYVPARNRIEMEGRFPMIHKNLNNQRRLWWARQGLNLRPHPCEGRGRFQPTSSRHSINQAPKNGAVRALYETRFCTGGFAVFAIDVSGAAV